MSRYPNNPNKKRYQNAPASGVEPKQPLKQPEAPSAVEPETVGLRTKTVAPFEGEPVQMREALTEPYNLNDTVMFRITSHGRLVYQSHYTNHGLLAPELRPDGAGLIGMPLWKMALIFGNDFYMGNTKQSIENNRIYFPGYNQSATPKMEVPTEPEATGLRTKTVAPFEEKLDELIATFANTIKTKAMELYRSGAIDPEAYGDDYRLPKILITAAAESEKGSLRPLHPEDKLTVANLRNF